jgi:hypothetical protein
MPTRSKDVWKLIQNTRFVDLSADIKGQMIALKVNRSELGIEEANWLRTKIVEDATKALTNTTEIMERRARTRAMKRRGQLRA